MDKQQSKCAGLLVFEASADAYKYQGASSYKSKCYGVTSSVADEVDLHTHHDSRTGIPDATLISFTCLGKAVYQHGPNSAQGQTPPPFCLGVEFLRYGQAVMQHRPAAAGLPATATAAHHQGYVHNSDAMPSPADMAHRAQMAASSSYQHTSSASSTADAATVPSASYHHAAQHQHDQEVGAASSTSSSRAAQPITARRQRQQEQQEQQEQLSFLEKVQRTRNEVNERLEGKDPLWFAKAFAHRAELNWESMKRMAGEMAAAAKADLGFQENDETE